MGHQSKASFQVKTSRCFFVQVATDLRDTRQYKMTILGMGKIDCLLG